MSSGVSLRSEIGLEIVAARGILAAQFTGFHSQIFIPDGANVQIIAALYLAATASVEFSQKLFEDFQPGRTSPVEWEGGCHLSNINIELLARNLAGQMETLHKTS